MLTDGGATQSTTMHPAATRRILRLALGTAMCLAFSQAVAWPLSFIAPVLTLLILALPLLAPVARAAVAVQLLPVRTGTAIAVHALIPAPVARLVPGLVTIPVRTAVHALVAAAIAGLVARPVLLP